ncbi:MAG: PqqD family protein [Cyanobacteria bacterium J06635_1]
MTAIPEHVCSDLNGEIVILNLKSGTYFGLNETGALVWNLIKNPKTVDQLRTAILDEYEVEDEVCDRDLTALLQALAEQNLIEVTNAEATQTVD